MEAAAQIELREFGTGLLEHVERHGAWRKDPAGDIAAARLTAELLFAVFRGTEADEVALALVPDALAA